MVIGTPEVEVPTLIPFDVSVLFKLNSPAAVNAMVVPASIVT